MRNKQIGTITFFTAVVTYLALYFQWTEFYKGYSYSSFNLSVSIIFLLEWMLFSFYWGKIQEEKYQKRKNHNILLAGNKFRPNYYKLFLKCSGQNYV